MLLEREGKGKAAQKVRDAALNFPIGPGGRTIAKSLAAAWRGRRLTDNSPVWRAGRRSPRRKQGAVAVGLDRLGDLIDDLLELGVVDQAGAELLGENVLDQRPLQPPVIERADHVGARQRPCAMRWRRRANPCGRHVRRRRFSSAPAAARAASSRSCWRWRPDPWARPPS